MMLTDFKNMWDSLDKEEGIAKQRRVDSSHPLNIFIGYDAIGDREFIIITNTVPRLSLKSSSIHIGMGVRKDNKYALCFRLVGRSFETVFVQLCWDLFEHTRNVKDEIEGLKTLQNRFKVWQKMFEIGNSGLLSIEAIKGLIGELVFLKEVAIKKYGIEKSIKSWIGPEGAHKDYFFDTTWYEIKTIDSASKDIIISSLQQLESDMSGTLTCVLVEKTSQQAGNHITLPSIINDIRKLLADKIRLEFNDKLIRIGYVDREEYDSYAFSLIGIKHYYVDDTFPKITSSLLDVAITEVKYKISIAGIKRWEYNHGDERV